MSTKKQYTDAEKAAYYKKKLAESNKTVVYSAPKRRVYKKKPAAKKPAATGGALVKAGSGIGSGLGSALAGPAGAGIGSFLGGKLGHLIESITGFGDYKVEQNTILKGGMSPPQIVNSVDNGGVIIRHREYLGDIHATTAFTVQSYLVQPGLANTFPWLSQIANSYEQYRLRGMIFEFNSTSSDAVLSTATSTALGTVVMMTDYDVADDPPTSKRQMLNSEWSCSSKPSCTLVHPIECKKSQTAQNILYTRGTYVVPDGFDQRLYDFCRFNIATEGMQAAGGVVGELWVSYEIELFKQQYAYFGAADHFRSLLLTNARPLGTVSGSNIGSGGTIGGLISGAGTDYSFPPQYSSGKYFFCYSAVGGGIANVFAPSLTFTNCSLLSLWLNDTLGYLNLPNPAVASNQIGLNMVGTVIITAENAVIHFGTNGVVPGVTNALDFWVIRIPDSMTTLN